MIITTKEQILEHNHILKFTDDEIAAIADVACDINNDVTLSGYAQAAYDRIFVEHCLHSDAAGALPDTVNIYANGLFWTVVYISGLHTTIDYYNKHNISLDILSDTVQDMALWMRFYKRNNNTYGQESASWMWWSFGAKLFRLGRLQFAPETFSGDVEVYRHKLTGKTITMAAGGIEYRRDGYRNGLDGIYQRNAKHTLYYCGIDSVIAHVVNDDATIQTKPTHLDLSEYDCVLRKGDMILAVHIPQGERMDHQECCQSFEAAKLFFPEKLGCNFKAFTCGSWLLDPVWKSALSSNSNIRLFCERFSLVPTISSDVNEAIKFFVFQDKSIDLNTATPKTSLQKLILDKIADGHDFREPFGFLLND